MRMTMLSGKLHKTVKRALPLAVAAVVCLCGMQAFAQGGGTPLTQEQRDAAAALEAKSVAKSLSLSADLTTKLTDAFKASRANLQKAISGLSSDLPRADRRTETQKLTVAERENLKKALAGFLKPDQADKAAATLGAYNQRWDRFVSTIADLKLADDKQDKALALINTFVTDAAAAMEKAGNDRSAVMTAVMDAKGKLDKGLGDVLDAAQLAKWNEATAFRPGGGGGPGAGGGLGGGQAAAGGAPKAPAAAPAPAPAPAAPAPKK